MLFGVINLLQKCIIGNGPLQTASHIFLFKSEWCDTVRCDIHVYRYLLLKNSLQSSRDKFFLESGF